MSTTLIDPAEVPVLEEVDFEGLETAVGQIRQAAGTIERRGGEIDGAWLGGIGMHWLVPNGVALSTKMFPVKQKASELAESSQSAADALQGYVNEAKPIKERLRRVREDAEALREKVRQVSGGAERWEDKPELVEENERLKQRMSRAVNDHEDARDTAAERINATNNGPGMSGLERAADTMKYGYIGTTGFGYLASHMTHYKYGKFAPMGYHANGRYGFVKFKGAPWWQNMHRGMRGGNWNAKPYKGATRSKWMTASKWGGRVSPGIAAATSGLDQWDKDSQDKNMSTGKQVARTGVKSGATAGGMWGGAKAGAAVGTGIGAMFAGVGAPVGAAVGGLAGAVAGSKFGGWAGDKINGWIGK